MPTHIREDSLDIRTIRATRNGREVEAGIQPGCGGNLVSFKVDGQEYLHYDREALLDTERLFTGCFVMFPTPCRVPDGTYTFEGRKIIQTKRGEIQTIHGLVRDEPFEADFAEDRATLWLDITPDSPVYEGYPFESRLGLTLRCIEGGIEYGFCFENRGDAPAPVGFGLHPFWKVPGRREDVTVTIPCEKIMTLENLIPTGETQSVAGTELDLRHGRRLSEMEMDAVFLDRIGGAAPATIEYRDRGTKLSLHADALFTHQVAYSPAGKTFACVEYLTCSPNQVNLQHIPEAGHRVVESGGKLAAAVRFVVEDL